MAEMFNFYPKILILCWFYLVTRTNQNHLITVDFQPNVGISWTLFSPMAPKKYYRQRTVYEIVNNKIIHHWIGYGISDKKKQMSANFFQTVSRILIKSATDFGDCLRALKIEIGFLLGQTVAMKGINKLELQAPKVI